MISTRASQRSQPLVPPRPRTALQTARLHLQVSSAFRAVCARASLLAAAWVALAVVPPRDRACDRGRRRHRRAAAARHPLSPRAHFARSPPLVGSVRHRRRQRHAFGSCHGGHVRRASPAIRIDGRRAGLAAVPGSQPESHAHAVRRRQQRSSRGAWRQRWRQRRRWQRRRWQRRRWQRRRRWRASLSSSQPNRRQRFPRLRCHAHDQPEQWRPHASTRQQPALRQRHAVSHRRGNYHGCRHALPQPRLAFDAPSVATWTSKRAARPFERAAERRRGTQWRWWQSPPPVRLADCRIPLNGIRDEQNANAENRRLGNGNVPGVPHSPPSMPP